MSLENIINQIDLDTKKEVDNILDDAKKQADEIIKQAKINAKEQSKEIISKGNKKSDIIRQIIISKENQNAKKKITKTKEEIIDLCFDKSYYKLKQLNNKEYEKISNQFFKQGINRIGKDCSVKYSNEVDKNIAKKYGLKLIEKIDTIGGIILISGDGKITLDNTFEGIMKREKDRIRIKVGKILFS